MINFSFHTTRKRQYSGIRQTGELCERVSTHIRESEGAYVSSGSD